MTSMRKDKIVESKKDARKEFRFLEAKHASKIVMLKIN